MNSETKLMIGFSTIVNFMKEQVATTLIEANAAKTIELDQATLVRLTSLVQSSMQSAFNKAAGEVESIAREFTNK